MYAAIVHQTNQPPSYASFAMPEARQGECLITVNAAAISHVVKSRASACLVCFSARAMGLHGRVCACCGTALHPSGG